MLMRKCERPLNNRLSIPLVNFTGHYYSMIELFLVKSMYVVLLTFHEKAQNAKDRYIL